MPATPSRSASARARRRSRRSSWCGRLAGIASDGHFVRPHVGGRRTSFPPISARRFWTSFPGSGDKNVPLNPDTWMTITDGMAAATTTGTAAGLPHRRHRLCRQDRHRPGGGRRRHPRQGRRARPPTPGLWAWCPGAIPELAIVVLQEHGDWGANSAHIAQAIVTTYVNKKRRQDTTSWSRPAPGKPVEVGAVWSTRAAQTRDHGQQQIPRKPTSSTPGTSSVDPSADSRPSRWPAAARLPPAARPG